MGYESVVAQVARLEHSAHDFADVDDAHQRAGRMANEMRQTVCGASSLQQLAVLFDGSGGLDPATVELGAAPGCLQVLGLPAQRRLFEKDLARPLRAPAHGASAASPSGLQSTTKYPSGSLSHISR